MSFLFHFLLSYHAIAYFTEWFLMHISILSVLAYPLALVILDKFSLLLGCSAEEKVKEEITLRWKKLYIFLIVHFCGHAKHLTELWVTHFITNVQPTWEMPPVLTREWRSGCRQANTCMCPTVRAPACMCLYQPCIKLVNFQTLTLDLHLDVHSGLLLEDYRLGSGKPGRDTFILTQFYTNFLFYVGIKLKL